MSVNPQFASFELVSLPEAPLTNLVSLMQRMARDHTPLPHRRPRGRHEVSRDCRRESGAGYANRGDGTEHDEVGELELRAEGADLGL